MVTYLDTVINNVAENAVDMDLRDREADAIRRARRDTNY